MWNLG